MKIKKYVSSFMFYTFFVFFVYAGKQGQSDNFSVRSSLAFFKHNLTHTKKEIIQRSNVFLRQIESLEKEGAFVGIAQTIKIGMRGAGMYGVQPSYIAPYNVSVGEIPKVSVYKAPHMWWEYCALVLSEQKEYINKK